MRWMVMAVLCLLLEPLAACVNVSPAEQALNRLRGERRWIEEVGALRESGKTCLPVQQRVCETLQSFDEVASCECVLAPETWETQTVNGDQSITYGRETRLRYAVLIALKPREAIDRNRLAWNKERARNEVAALLTDCGYRGFTLDLPVQSGNTWVVTGYGPVERDGGKQ